LLKLKLVRLQRKLRPLKPKPRRLKNELKHPTRKLKPSARKLRLPMRRPQRLKNL